MNLRRTTEVRALQGERAADTAERTERGWAEASCPLRSEGKTIWNPGGAVCWVKYCGVACGNVPRRTRRRLGRQLFTCEHLTGTTENRG